MLTPYQKTHIVNSEGEIIDVFGGGGTGGTGGGSTDMSETNNRIGAKTEPAATSPTASSGLNGLLRLLINRLVPGTSGGVKVEVVAGGGANMTETNNRLGSTSEAIATSNTAPSGLNGLLRRLLSLLPSSLADGRFKVEASTPAIAWTAQPVLDSLASGSGSSKTWTVPAGVEWQLIQVHASLSTSANAGNRQLAIQLNDGANNVYGHFPVGSTQSASTTRTYTFGVGLPDFTSFRNTDKLLSPIPPVILPSGFIIKIYDSASIDPINDAIQARMLVMQRRI